MKKMISVFVLFTLVLSLFSGITPVLAASHTYHYLIATDFETHMGTWTMSLREPGSFQDFTLHASIDGNPANTIPAVCTIEIPADGEYFVWARTKDFDTGPGTRLSKLGINDTVLPNNLGKHDTGVTGWKWELAGSIALTKGSSIVKAIDSTANRARINVIAITTDKSYVPPEEISKIEGEVNKYRAKILETDIANMPTPKPTVAPTPTPVVVMMGTTETRSNHLYYIMRPDHFKDTPGGWSLQTNDGSGSYEKTMMIGSMSGTKADDALAKANFPEDTTYYFWTRSRDYADAKSGTRTYKIAIDGVPLPNIVGKHGQPGYQWELAGFSPLFKGEKNISLIDVMGNYARFDMLLVTTDPDFIPASSEEGVDTLVKKLYYKPENFPIKTSADSNRPQDEIAVKLNGEYMKFDVEPVLLNGRTLVPFRAIFEALGCSVSWDETNETAYGERNGKLIRLTIGAPNAFVDGKARELDQSAVLINGRTLVPLRFVSEALGAVVNWDEKTKTVSIMAQIAKAAYLIRPESFLSYGTWTMETGYKDAFGQSYLAGIGYVPPEKDDPKALTAVEPEARPATAIIPIKKTGSYKIWVHARDFATNQPGTRYLNIAVNDKFVEKKFGTHGKDGFAWVEAGIFELKEGENKLELLDTSKFFSRCDAILITEDLELIPSESYEELLALAAPYDVFSTISASFPNWAKASSDPTEVLFIENASTRVEFLKVPTNKGMVIQNEIYAKNDNKWVKVKDRSEDFGYLVMQAVSSITKNYDEDFPIFKQVISHNGYEREILTTNIYKSGIPVWFVANDFKQTSDNTITLSFDNPLAQMEVTWKLEQNANEPQVTVDTTFHEKGAYSIGVFNGKEYFDKDYTFALAPFRVQGKRVKPDAGITLEHYMFTPMGTVTLSKENSILPGKLITKGVVVDPSFIDYGWVYRDTSTFGIGMRGADGGVQGGIFAPAFGLSQSNFEKGESFSITYRPINKIDDWFETYTHITQNIYDVHDYRTHYYCSLTDAIFNTRELMMDDLHGGWDPVDKAYYNMESKNVTTQANPMIALQVYLLTEDKDYLEKRTIPTIVNLLTRSEFHFNRTTQRSSVDYVGGKPLPRPVGQPIASFNLNVYGGMYEMTRGMVPALLDIGIDNSEKAGVVNSYGSIPGFSNDIVLYKYTGDKKYYDRAVEAADKYIDNFFGKPQINPPTWASFGYISYYPNLSSLIDIYDMTGDEKYLNAAIETGKWLSTMVWVPGIDGEKKDMPVTITPEMITAKPFISENAAFYWRGDYQWVKGNKPGVLGTPEAVKDLKTETVPGWVPSRVGLGLEQASTFNNALNMIMSSWTGDLTKLAAYSGEEYFNIVARNAMIGRFSNYPGYYQNRIMTFHQKPEYIYEGPDYTSIYYHHIPPFLAMLEDFLINEMMHKSEGNIFFPALRQQGYAYFNSNQFGHESGSFFGQKDMWLWLDRGIIQTDSLQIDWLAARKDGVLGLSLLNEADTETTTTITLGDKVPGGSQFSGKATLYTSDGTSSEIEIAQGKFTVSIPAKKLAAALIDINSVKAPAYSKVSMDYSTEIGKTVADHANGKAYALQLTPESYYAYVYITDMPEASTKLTMKYKISAAEEVTISTDTYPYEFIIPVPDSKQSFTYTLEIQSVDGKTSKTETKTIEAKVK